MYVARTLEAELKPFLPRKEAIAIVGPRQAGKTTLLKKIEASLAKEKNVKYYSFENMHDLNIFQTDIESFVELNKKYDVIIIDEFQYAKNGGKLLKLLVDTTPAKYIISGSSSLELTFQVGKYMVGRLLSFQLYPFSFREYLAAVNSSLHQLLKQKIPDILSMPTHKEIFGAEVNKLLLKHFTDYLIWGGYPAVTLAESSAEKKKLLESVVNNYLLKDIGSLLKLATEEELQILARFLATQIGNLINYKELSDVSNLKYPVLLKHLNILKQTYIINLIKPFFINKRTELVKNPKVFFVDNGFRNFILSDFRQLPHRNDVGALVENVVLSEFQRRGLDRINFWRSKSGAEVDFIVQANGKLLPVEVKFSKRETVGKSLHSFINKFSPPEAVVFTKDYFATKLVKKTKVKFLPVYYL